MSRHRFYAPLQDISQSTIALSPDESHHLFRVLRLRHGDEVSVFDGLGSDYLCRVSHDDGGRAILEVIRRLTDLSESPVSLTLAQALVKGEKFDFIVQKATELGVRRIVPVVTDYCDVRIADERADRRLGRWRRVALEALKQSGGRVLVDIEAPQALTEFLQRDTNWPDGPITREMPLVLVFTEKGGEPIDPVLADCRKSAPVTAVIGPEGGWSNTEITAMIEFGCRAITLGPRTLRTETASIAAITLIQHALGDLSR